MAAPEDPAPSKSTADGAGAGAVASVVVLVGVGSAVVFGVVTGTCGAGTGTKSSAEIASSCIRSSSNQNGQDIDNSELEAQALSFTETYCQVPFKTHRKKARGRVLVDSKSSAHGGAKPTVWGKCKILQVVMTIWEIVNQALVNSGSKLFTECRTMRHTSKTPVMKTPSRDKAPVLSPRGKGLLLTQSGTMASSVPSYEHTFTVLESL